jgi:hypothetical protein
MRILKTFWQGLGTTNTKINMVVYLWLVNFVFSLLMAAPIYSILYKDLSRSLMADQVARGIDLLWLGDILYKHKNLFPSLAGWLLIPGVLFLLLHIFLNGGVLGGIVYGEEKIDLSRFFSFCGRYFSRFFRVFLISLVGYVLVLGGVYQILAAPFNLWKRNASSEWGVIISSNLKFLILILLFSIIRMFFDYVKIRLVVEDSQKAIRATMLNLSFLRKRFWRAWALYLLVGSAVILLGIIYLAVYQNLPKMGFMLLLAFVWQQIYIFSKMWTKVLFFSTEYHLFSNYR